MITSHFRSSAVVPPGVAVVTNGEVVIFFGPVRDLAEKMDALPPGSLIHVSIQNYVQISKAAQAADPTAPSIEQQNKEFAGLHKHPKSGREFSVYAWCNNQDEWVWSSEYARGPSDLNRYPTAEAAYLAAIGD